MSIFAQSAGGLVFAGVDIGFGHIKLDVEFPDDTMKLSMQATVATGRSLNLKKWQRGGEYDNKKSDLENQLASMDVEIYNHQNDVTKHYFMGQTAIIDGTDARLCWDDDKSSDEDSIALMVATLAAAQTSRMNGIDSKITVYVGTGLPIDKFFAHKDSYERNIKGTYSVTFKSGPWETAKCTISILRCRVFPQGWGIFADMTQDDDGQTINTHLGKGYVLFIDPGFRTTDYVLFNNGEFVDAYTNTFEIGVAWAYKQMCDKLGEKGIVIDEKEFDFYLTQMDGKYPLSDGRIIDLVPLQETAFKMLSKKLSEELKLRLQEVWGKIQKTMVGGGGGAGVFEFLNINGKELVTNPRFGNASGFKKASQRKIKKAMKLNA